MAYLRGGLCALVAFRERDSDTPRGAAQEGKDEGAERASTDGVVRTTPPGETGSKVGEREAEHDMKTSLRGAETTVRDLGEQARDGWGWSQLQVGFGQPGRDGSSLSQLWRFAKIMAYNNIFYDLSNKELPRIVEIAPALEDLLFKARPWGSCFLRGLL